MSSSPMGFVYAWLSLKHLSVSSGALLVTILSFHDTAVSFTDYAEAGVGRVRVSISAIMLSVECANHL